MHPVVVRYGASPGSEEEMGRLVARHWPARHTEGLTSEQPAVGIAVSRQPEVFVEYDEWLSWEAVQEAHDHPAARKIWDVMERVGRVEPWDGTYPVPPSRA